MPPLDVAPVSVSSCDVVVDVINPLKEKADPNEQEKVAINCIHIPLTI